MSRKSLLAFTLTEMLIVIGIIAVLAGLLLPSLDSAQREARMVSCIANLKNVSYSIDMYENDFYNQTPPWLSSTDLYETPNVLVCPEDQSMGAQGSIPDWITNASQFAETNDMAEEDFSDTDKGVGNINGNIGWYKSTFSEFLVDGKRRTETSRRSLKANSGKKIKGSSYLYEFNGECVSWGEGEDDTWGQGQPKGTSWHDSKIYQRDFCVINGEPSMASRVPIARCFHHISPRSDGQMKDEYQQSQNVPAIRITRSVNKSWPKHWESENKITEYDEDQKQ